MLDGNMDNKDKYSYIPMAGETSYSSKSDEIMKRYERIVYELLGFMLGGLVYVALCRQWLLLIICGIVVFSLYTVTKKEIKEIKRSLS